jgi:thymidylate synthase (FAD)
MNPTFWTAPRLTRLSASGFTAPDHLPMGEVAGNHTTDFERLCEYAGRVCYMSQHNPGGKTSNQYFDHILELNHTSIFEHAVVTWLIEGVSRSLTHELIRHRVGTGISQLSQRYCGEEHVGFVVPPALLERDVARARFEQSCEVALRDYADLVTALEADGLPRKQAREAARAVLPNATETKLVWTCNLRELRHVIALRDHPAADAEIQRWARAVLWEVSELAPNVMDDLMYDRGLG